MPELETLGDGATFKLSYGGRDCQYRDEMYIHFIDGVRSVPEFAERFRHILTNHGLERHA